MATRSPEPENQGISKKSLRRHLKKILGFKPGHLHYYRLAFIHRSASLEGPGGNPVNNERLEFLGDAILDAAISDYLFLQYPFQDEGSLSRMRASIVRRETLNELAIQVGLDKLLVSHTESNRKVKHLWGNSFEALVGAIYLDKGYKTTRKFITRRILKSYLDVSRLQQENRDHKSQLVEWAQKNRQDIRFDYENGTDEHRELLFTTRIFLDQELVGTGSASSKKGSEQLAAGHALRKLAVRKD